MIFRELLQYCRVKAIGDALQADEASVYREHCRSYSETFHTPLMEVLKLDPEWVILNNFEHQLKDIDLEKNIDNVLEEIYTIENPDYEKEKEEELQQFIKQVEEKALKQSKKTLPKKEVKAKEMRSGGSFDVNRLNPKNEG